MCLIFEVNLELVLYKNIVVFTDERGADRAMDYLTNRLTRTTIKPSISRLSSHKLPQAQHDLLVRRGYNVAYDPQIMGILLKQHKPVYFDAASSMKMRSAALDLSGINSDNPLIMLIDDATSHQFGDYATLKQYLRKLALGNSIGLYFALVTDRNLPSALTDKCDVLDM